MKREARTSLNRYLTCHNLNRFLDFFLFRHCRVKESRLCNFLQNPYCIDVKHSFYLLLIFS